MISSKLNYFRRRHTKKFIEDPKTAFLLDSIRVIFILIKFVTNIFSQLLSIPRKAVISLH